MMSREPLKMSWSRVCTFFVLLYDCKSICAVNIE